LVIAVILFSKHYALFLPLGEKSNFKEAASFSTIYGLPLHVTWIGHPGIDTKIFQDEDNMVLIATDTIIECNGHTSKIKKIL
jgi:hypothetical protein